MLVAFWHLMVVTNFAARPFQLSIRSVFAVRILRLYGIIKVENCDAIAILA